LTISPPPDAQAHRGSSLEKPRAPGDFTPGDYGPLANLTTLATGVALGEGALDAIGGYAAAEHVAENSGASCGYGVQLAATPSRPAAIHFLLRFKYASNNL
jgi:hypothetical protein